MVDERRGGMQSDKTEKGQRQGLVQLTQRLGELAEHEAGGRCKLEPAETDRLAGCHDGNNADGGYRHHQGVERAVHDARGLHRDLVLRSSAARLSLPEQRPSHPTQDQYQEKDAQRLMNWFQTYSDEVVPRELVTDKLERG